MKKILNGTHKALLPLLLLPVCLIIPAAQQSRPYKVSEEEVRNLLMRLEERADGFRSLVDIVLEVSRLDGTPREDRLDLLTEDFEREVDALENRFNKDASTAADVERVLRAAERVNGPLTRALADHTLHPDPSLRERTLTEWTLLKSSLNNLADFYNLEWKWAGTAADLEESSRKVPASQTVTIRGRLRRTVEPGGWLIDTGARQYLIINAGRFQSAQWFRTGAQVSATGNVRREVLTTHMQGTPFEARSVQPSGRSRHRKEPR